MTREEVWSAVSAYLSEEFGKLVVVRDVRRVRRVAGDCWAVVVAIVNSAGDIPVQELSVDEDGVMTPTLDGDDIAAAIRKATPTEKKPATDDFGLSGMGGMGGGLLDDFDDLVVPPESIPPGEGADSLRSKIEEFLAAGDDFSLRQVRELLPHLLADPDRRGATLLRMAAVEKRLAEPQIAMQYLEAASREFADRFDLPSLERAAGMAIEIVGGKEFSSTPIHAILELARSKVRPLQNVFDCKIFAPLQGDQRGWLVENFEVRTLSPNEILVREGEPSENVFVVKSGLLGVLLDTTNGGNRLVRCCPPGLLLGESSVSADDDPRCTATLRAQTVTEVWEMPGAVLKMVMDKDKALSDRIMATRQLHRIDSFFSMHESIGGLDVLVRDELLSAIDRVETFDSDTTILKSGVVPESAYLVARGSLFLKDPEHANAAPVTVAADHFFGVRDALHQIPSALEAVATSGTQVAILDASKLRALSERSPDHVVAVLERLG